MANTALMSFGKPGSGSLIPTVDPMIAAMSQRSTDAFSSLSGLLNRPEEKPMSRADGLNQWGEPAMSTPQGDNSHGNDGYTAQGFADNVPRSLIGTESGGNWGARNNEVGSGGKSGHFGILQFGQDRYSEAVKAGAVPAGMSIEQFGSDTPEGRAAQVSASNWHFNDIDSRIRSKGFDRMIGQTIGGVPVTWDAMRSMAHLGGFGGLTNFLNSGGSANPADAYGTSLAAYGQTHS